MSVETTSLVGNRPTARELLARVGGEEHAMHSVVRKSPVILTVLGRVVRFECSCGSCFEAPAAETGLSLRNIEEKGGKSP